MHMIFSRDEIIEIVKEHVMREFKLPSQVVLGAWLNLPNTNEEVEAEVTIELDTMAASPYRIAVRT